MRSFKYTIKDEIGIHARPAGLLVKEAGKFNSQIIINNTKNGKSAEAKKLFGVMGLAVKCGDIVEISVDGDDEETAAQEMEIFFKNNL